MYCDKRDHGHRSIRFQYPTFQKDRSSAVPANGSLSTKTRWLGRSVLDLRVDLSPICQTQLSHRSNEIISRVDEAGLRDLTFRFRVTLSHTSEIRRLRRSHIPGSVSWFWVEISFQRSAPCLIIHIRKRIHGMECRVWHNAMGGHPLATPGHRHAACIQACLDSLSPSVQRVQASLPLLPKHSGSGFQGAGVHACCVEDLRSSLRAGHAWG